MTDLRPSQGHEQLDHTADLALEFWAPTQEALLLEGALALIEVLTEDAEFDGKDERKVSIDAVDGQDRMVQFLNEVLYAAVTHGFLTEAADIELGDNGLSATLYGEAAGREHIAAELKSVTYHGLRLENHEYGWYGQVVVDV